MTNVVNRPREIAIPASAFATVRRALEAELGADGAADVLRQSGHAAGDAMASFFDEDTADRGAADCWRRLAELLAARGWGSLEHSDPNPGIGALDSPDWAEADPAAGAARPSCFFTTGLFANLLGRFAGDTVGVLEVECRSRGDLRCRFLFGAPSALERIDDAVAAGRGADAAIAEMG